MCRGWALLVAISIVAACDGGGDAMPDAGPPSGDGAQAACREIGTPAYTASSLPMRIDGDLVGAGADLESPAACAEVDAPFGAISAGADQVIEVTGLEPGAEYRVRLEADEDLAFYVVTGCSSADGPTDSDCLLFVDASSDRVETGRFVAPAATAFIVVDFFSSRTLDRTSFSVDLYQSGCDSDDDCDGTTPTCVDHRCVGCTTSFDCKDPQAPVCDTASHTCRAGSGGCAGDDDARENRDDGPAGATPLPLGTTGYLCDGLDERDYFRFDVDTPGEYWQVSLAWLVGEDLQLEAYDATGQLIGKSLHEMPEQMLLTYLPVGRYYVSVSWRDPRSSAAPVLYSIAALGIAGYACVEDSDCADAYRNQAHRGRCEDGACVRIEGNGTVPVGAACDSQSDCDADGECPSFLFTADADTRSVCGLHCRADADCAAMGSGHVCTTYLPENFCVQRCTEDDHCPVLADTAAPVGEPWARYVCQESTGRCVRPASAR
jgi:hypothetical protein